MTLGVVRPGEAPTADDDGDGDGEAEGGTKPPAEAPAPRYLVQGVRAEQAARPVRGATFQATAAELSGYVGFYLEQVDVYITSLEIRGLLDPEILK